MDDHRYIPSIQANLNGIQAVSHVTGQVIDSAKSLLRKRMLVYHLGNDVFVAPIIWMTAFKQHAAAEV